MEAYSGNKGGRSSAFIYFTYDRRFVLKTLKMSEVRFLERSFDRLIAYLLSEDGKESYLARILALFTLKTAGHEHTHLVVAENVLPGEGVDLIFDLKGSVVNRAVLADGQTLTLEAKGQVLKDVDFHRVKGTLVVGEQQCERFYAQVQRDASFLESIRAMDYSLLLGLSTASSVRLPTHHTLAEHSTSELWYLGIIDYLQEYNVKKHLETVSHKLASPTGPLSDRSCVNPVLYRVRFCEFMQKVVSAN